MTINYFGKEYPRSARSFPTGPGSRGGRWHDPEFRKQYHREWRAAHPEVRARERLRMWRKRHGDEPMPEPKAMNPAEYCACNCGCRSEVVTMCGFCREGLHKESA
jgi:hypothetical protein